jgi:hypothetical protein
MRLLLKEKIILATIPVIGTILVAILTTQKFTCTSKPPSNSDPSVNFLKVKAGKINDIIVYGRYDDLLPLMSDELKLTVSKQVFESAEDSIHKNFSNFIKPIDTNYSSAYGNFNFTIKNQYEKGTNINSIIFDKQGNLIGFYCSTKPN